ncbi:MAG: proline--tRNA ligase [Patescibacteria group bacterium]
MKQSKLLVKTQKSAPKIAEAISHQLLLRGDFISQLTSGVYSFLPLGMRVYRKIESIVREEMEALGAQEIFMPSLIPQQLWLETKRWTEIDPPLFQVKDRHNKLYGLGPTHEEVVTDLVRQRVKSYKDLPFSVFQIQNKFRNEMRAQGGLLRTREFIMKDLYSFHKNEKEVEVFYEKVKKAYFNILKRVGLNPICVAADSGTIGGSFSNEFMIVAEVGEDKILVCPKCKFSSNIEKSGMIKNCPNCKTVLEVKKAIEVGHIFILGTKYSEAMKANFTDEKGETKPIIMGCYGIGLPRLLSAIVEVNNDERGIIWPQNIAPFQVHLLSTAENKKVESATEKLYNELKKANIEVLYDDRNDKSFGEKLFDSDLIGIPWRVVVSEKTLKEDAFEIKNRGKKKIELVDSKKIIKELSSCLKKQERK